MWLSYLEERELMADLVAQERGDTLPSTPEFTLSPGYVRCEAGMHPDHGEAVIFQPGQLLPGWAAEALEKQRPIPTPDGIYELVKPEETRKR
jgi:hypothetical protein